MKDRPLVVACVLKSGGTFLPEHVQALQQGVAKSLPDNRFVCLSDMDVPGVERMPLVHGLPGWWSKLELFSPGVFQTDTQVLYIDLDTVIVGDLSDIAAYRGDFAVLQDFFMDPPMIGSGMMLWRDSGPTRRIWRAYKEGGKRVINQGRRMDHFILGNLTEPFDRIQTLWPGQVVSYKAHCRRAGAVPDGARVVCFHGVPRPWDPNLEIPLWSPPVF